MVEKIKKIILLFLLNLVTVISLYGAGTLCTQVVTVKFTPYDGVRLYTISGSGTGTGQDKRGVIDLGHFNRNSTVKELKVGTVTVIIEMVEDGNGVENNDFEVLDRSRLESYAWGYSYDSTSFIGNSVPNANIKTENFQVLEEINGTQQSGNQGTYNFMCLGEGMHEMHMKKFSYQFDLIVRLENLLEDSAMYGFSPKDSSSAAYINIMQIVSDQLKGSKIQ